MKYLLIVLCCQISFLSLVRADIPDYCSDPTYANDAACRRSNPDYCSDPTYADTLACEGSQPDYCNDPTYANTRACANYDFGTTN
jgi:hypothetical protein